MNATDTPTNRHLVEALTAPAGGATDDTVVMAALRRRLSAAAEADGLTDSFG